MPVYTYECTQGHQFDLIYLSYKDKEKYSVCPKCSCVSRNIPARINIETQPEWKLRLKDARRENPNLQVWEPGMEKHAENARKERKVKNKKEAKEAIEFAIRDRAHQLPSTITAP